MNAQLFEKITRFYQNFDQRTLHVEGNVCKECQCNECCTFAAKGGKHSVSKMEFDYIEQYYREKGYPQGSVELFKEYLARKRNKQGKVIHGICPFFNLEYQGCSIYEARPLSCRMYGSFFLEGFSVPSQCYFIGKGKTVRRGAFLEDVPLALEFFELRSEHLGTRPVKISRQESSPFMDRDLDDLPAFDMKTDPYVRACKLEKEKKFEEAISAYREAREKYPDWSFIPSCMGTDFIILQRFGEAMEAATQAVSMRPANAFYHFILAMAFELGGKLDEAITEYRETLRLNPQNAIANASLANLYNNKSMLQESLQHYEKAIELDPECVYYRYYCGVVLNQMRLHEKAEEQFKKAIELDPNLALAYLGLAQSYYATNRLEEAKTTFQKYTDLSSAQNPAALQENVKST